MIERVENPRAARDGYRGFFTDDDYARVGAYYARHPDVRPTPLVPLPNLAARLGLRALAIKDESRRLGLNAFKGVGAFYAIDRLLSDAASPPAALVCASAGNHGRAVAHAGGRLGIPVRVFMSAAAPDAPRRAIEREGAHVIAIDGTYDDAVRAAAEDVARTGAALVSDTAWPGYESIPRDIMAGYTQILEEARSQWDTMPDVTIVQAGVGSLAASMAAWWSDRFAASRPRFVCCEPLNAAPLLESARAGCYTVSTRPMETIMGGLGCREASSLAVPVLLRAADEFVAIEDDAAREAMRRLARPAGGDPVIVSGPSGAAGLGALLALGDRDRPLGARVLLINTEGATDPLLSEKIIRD